MKGWASNFCRWVASLAGLATLVVAGAALAGGTPVPMISTCGPTPPASPCVTRWTCLDGSWEPTYRAAGTTCNDGNACTSADKCDGRVGAVERPSPARHRISATLLEPAIARRVSVRILRRPTGRRATTGTSAPSPIRARLACVPARIPSSVRRRISATRAGPAIRRRVPARHRVSSRAELRAATATCVPTGRPAPTVSAAAERRNPATPAQGADRRFVTGRHPAR